MGGLCRTIVASVLVGGGILLFGLGFGVKYSIFPQVVETLVYDNLDLKEGTEGWDSFVEPPVPVYMTFHIFNVSNPDEVLNGGKPSVEELGPYVYREVRRKEDIFEVDGDQLDYGLYMSYHFDQEKTIEAGCEDCTERDNVTVINGALLGINAILKMIPPDMTVNDTLNMLPPDLDIDLSNPLFGFKVVDAIALYIAVNIAPGGKYEDDLFNTMAVDDLLYQGYDSGILGSIFGVVDFLASLNIEIPEDLLDEVYDMLPDQIQGGKFGIFRGKNATKEKNYYTINNGRYEHHNFMSIMKFNGGDKLPESWWPNVAPTPSGQESGVPGFCHDIYGTDGTQFPPFVQKDVRKWLFVSELCRSIWLDFDQDVEVRGIDAFRYRPPKDVFDMRNKHNFCYCPEFLECATVSNVTDEWQPENCFDYCKDGMLRVEACYGGAPIIMTAPHFYNAFENLTDEVQGIHPEQDKHDTYLDIEPITGIALSAHKRIQVNMRLEPSRYFVLLNNVTTVSLFPLLWADEGADLDQTNEDKFKDMIVTPTMIVDGLSIGLGMVVGALLFIIGIVLLAKNRRSRSQTF